LVDLHERHLGDLAQRLWLPKTASTQPLWRALALDRIPVAQVLPGGRD
jgi:hypothetical protein